MADNENILSLIGEMRREMVAKAPAKEEEPVAQPSSTALEARRQEALTLTRGCKWNDALVLIDECLQVEPHDWPLQNAKAVALYRKGRSQEAMEILRSGIREATETQPFHHNLAYLLLDMGEPLEAVDHAIVAYQMVPTSTEARATLTRCRHELARKMRPLRRKANDDKGSKKLLSRLHDALTLTEQALAGGCAQAESGGNRISLVMIAKNEEEYLRDCLESVRGVVDEIILVDTGSTDSTRDIALEYGAKVFDHPWQDDFSDARNVSLAHATGEWALWLDADERLTSESAVKIRAMVDAASDNVGGFMATFRNYLSKGPNADIFWHRACRLFRNVPSARFTGRVHEQNARGIEAAGLEIHASDIQIDHLGYASEVMDERNKHERFISMLRREIEENPSDSYANFQMYNLGNAYYIKGDMENAIEWFSKAAEKVEAQFDFTAMLFVQWATAYYRLRRPVEALEICDRADAAGIVHPGIRFARGHSLLQLRDYDGAEREFLAAKEMGRQIGVLDIGDSGTYTYKADFGLALVYLAEDRHEDTVRASRSALAERPGFIEAHYTLAHGLSSLGRYAEAIPEYDAVVAAEPDHNPGAVERALVIEESGDHASALPLLERYANELPEDPTICAHLAHCYEQLGKLEEARGAYTRARELVPTSVEIVVNLGRVLAALGDDAGAVDCFTDAILIDRTYGNAYFNAADVLYRLGIYDRAIEVLQQGLTVDPANAAGFFVLGNCYFQLGDMAAAELCYRSALERKPGYQEAQNNLELATAAVATQAA